MSPIPRPIGWIRGRIIDDYGRPAPAFVDWLETFVTQVDTALTEIGQIAASAVIEGRSEGVGTTVQNLDVSGRLTDADQVAADGAAFARVTLNQRTGGGRAFNALDANDRILNSFRVNPLNVAGAPTSASTLSNDGASTVIIIAAQSFQYGPGTVSYNSGSVDPGAFGAFGIYADDPTYGGGAVSYQFTTSTPDFTAADGRIPFGVIRTTGGTPHTGGGFDGGDTGDPGGKGYAEIA